MDNEETFLLEIEKLENSNEAKDHIRLGNLYLSGCYIKRDEKKALKEFFKANELNDNLGDSQIAGVYLNMNIYQMLFNPKNENFDIGLEYLEKGIQKNNLDSYLLKANLLYKLEYYTKSKEIFEFLYEKRYTPSFYYYGKFLNHNHQYIDKNKGKQNKIKKRNKFNSRSSRKRRQKCNHRFGKYGQL
jgi:TPR repeat protein